jgi:hypothetical protein
VQDTDAFRTLDCKLHNTIKSLCSWSQKYIGSVRLQLVMENEMIQNLDQARDRWLLSSHEIDLRKELKLKYLDLASLS